MYAGSRLSLAQPNRCHQRRPFVAASPVRSARAVTCASAREQAAAPVDRRSALALVAGAICCEMSLLEKFCHVCEALHRRPAHACSQHLQRPRVFLSSPHPKCHWAHSKVLFCAAAAAVATTPAVAAEGFEDLTVSESGLAWKDTVEGTGKVPTAGATIRLAAEAACCHNIHLLPSKMRSIAHML